jgi:hypothetical protein
MSGPMRDSAFPMILAVPAPHQTPPDEHATGELEIAIIGMAGRFPGARDLNKF